jgi:ArsR family transcriptional regulator
MPRLVTQPDALLGWMDSLADATRLRLLRLLERHELGVADLCDVVQLPQSTVSRHLKVLADQDWLRSRQQGTSHLYRMTLDELKAPSRKLWVFAREQIDGWATVQQDSLRLSRLLSDKQKESQAFFAGAAGQWDRLRRELYGEHFGSAAMLALLPRDYVVADLGCGTGPVSEQVAPHVGKVIGVDSSDAMLEAARGRLKGLDNVDLRQGDLTSIPIDDASVDAAVLELVLSYVSEPTVVVRELARILKPGGKVVIVDLTPHDRDDFRRQMGQLTLGFSSDSVESLLTDEGMKNVTYSPLPPEPGVKGPALFLATGTKGT